MIKAKVYSQTNQEVGDIELREDVFGLEVRPELLHFVVRAHLAAKRQGTVSVKNRAKIRGGGRKPWRQKGTGRARAGTIRSPLWRGGAVIHGPQPRDYSFKVNKKVKRLALKMALSSLLKENRLKIVDKFDFPEIKTKKFVEVKNSLGLKKPLIVLQERYNNLELSARNVPGVAVLTQELLNTYDALKHSEVVIEKEAILKLQERLG
ncbi:50S ribosomal protein L4 [Desulfonauticus submarinus]|uniref:Large ribosomal subunit protein uL4 n=1 Tax=Desulfonauticus submarinus TaxID=206665 RepID=A0A1H0G5V5_9BACT|nr:50S ribosomal protein L4 [Desulfonauticus submarinus]SDO02240.1 large subunit ribosomal protein L4 [Desulfonauticus submarinus]